MEHDTHPATLDLLGISEATDKNSLSGDYLRHYERIFHHLRNEKFNFIEIGVYRGASARLWAKFFRKAQIVGIDVNPKCKEHASDRIAIEIGSQNDPAFLHMLATNFPPRVVIDDGSHQSYDIVFTFERLFPALEQGGIYVIEDLHFHHTEAAAERLRGGSPVLAHDYVAGLAKERLGGPSHVKALSGLKRHILSEIDRIEIISQAAIIFKKTKQDALAILKAARPYVEQSKSWITWFNYAQKLLEAGGSELDIVHALNQAAEAEPKRIVTYHRISEAQERIKNFEGALETLNKAIIVAEHDSAAVAELSERIERIRRLRGNS